MLDSLLFTELLQPLMHVYRTWKATQSDAEPGDVGFRASIVHEVDKLVEMFVREQPREVRGATGVVRPARMRVEAKRIASSFISDASAARSAARGSSSARPLLGVPEPLAPRVGRTSVFQALAPWRAPDTPTTAWTPQET